MVTMAAATQTASTSGTIHIPCRYDHHNKRHNNDAVFSGCDDFSVASSSSARTLKASNVESGRQKVRTVIIFAPSMISVIFSFCIAAFFLLCCILLLTRSIIYNYFTLLYSILLATHRIMSNKPTERVVTVSCPPARVHPSVSPDIFDSIVSASSFSLVLFPA